MLKHCLPIFSDFDEILRPQNLITITADGMAGIGDIYAVSLWILYPALSALILILAFQRIRHRYRLPCHELESQPETLPSGRLDIKATVESAVVAVDTSNSAQTSLSISGTIPSSSDPLRSQSYQSLRWPSSIPNSGYLASSRLKAQPLGNSQPDAQAQLESTIDISSENWKFLGPSIPEDAAPEVVPLCEDGSERGSSICAPLPEKESLGDSRRHSSTFLTESTVVPSSSCHQQANPSQESCSKIPSTNTMQKRSDIVQLFRPMDGGDRNTWRRRVIEYH
jgi:hypothetical protein